MVALLSAQTIAVRARGVNDQQGGVPRGVCVVPVPQMSVPASQTGRLHVIPSEQPNVSMPPHDVAGSKQHTACVPMQKASSKGVPRCPMVGPHARALLTQVPPAARQPFTPPSPPFRQHSAPTRHDAAPLAGW
jgi:hypothetical protein